jgi:hypothetical protein
VIRKSGIVGAAITVALRAGLVVTTLSVLTGASLAQNAGTLDMTRPALDKLLGTTSVQAEPSFKDGELVGCVIEFSALTKDFDYKQGGYIKVDGSFGSRSAKGRLVTMLKVILNDVDPRTMSLTPSAPASAYLVSGNKTTKNAVVGKVQSDTPGGILVVLEAEPTVPILTDGLTRDKVSIAFAREPGGTDIQLAIDTSVVNTTADGQRTHSLKPALDFGACNQELIESMLKTVTR